MTQETFDNKEDEFVKSLNLTEEKIIADLEEMKNIEGFPLGDVEDILELSEPPYYTAYPNPYIKDFIEHFGTPYDEETDNYDVEPFVGDISEGKNAKIYMAHSYHTKVPPKAIEQYIEHYTEPGDIVLDGFSGSGMTGVAARSINRNIILNDISPFATFLSSNYNNIHDLEKFIEDTDDIIKELQSEFEDLYVTKTDSGEYAKVNYVAWSDMYECPFCNSINTYYEFTDKLNSKDLTCPNCGVEIEKKSLQKIKKDGKVVTVPFLINYSLGRKRFNKAVDDFDINLINSFNKKLIPYWYPNDLIPDGYNLSQPKKSHQIERISDFYTYRSLLVLSKLYSLANYNLIKFVFTSLADRQAVIRNRYFKDGPSHGPLTNTLYVPDLQSEVNVIDVFKRKRNAIYRGFDSVSYNGNYIVSTQASNDMNNIPNNSIDYIFVDPPFGSNIMYSELNFILESWLKVKTNNLKEAIKNEKHHKLEHEYEELILECFNEFFRVLKPNRWITIEFNNSNVNIWKIIQNAIIKSGFVIAQVAILDKIHTTLHQDAKINGSVKKDLVINAYKPSSNFGLKFLQKNGINMELEFIEMHLSKLPLELNIERTQQMLYSKLLAQYIQNGFDIPSYNASDFYELLKRHFVDRNGFWFTYNQIDKFDKKNAFSKNLKDIDDHQSILGIYDEKSAIIWLNQFLKEPKTYDEIFINFSKNLLTSFDKIPELKILLEENFILNNGKYSSPSDLEKINIEKLRNKRLLSEFNNLLKTIKQSKNNIKEVRKEALFLGLKNLYAEKDVDTIKLLGERIDNKIIDSDEDILSIINWAKYK